MFGIENYLGFILAAVILNLTPGVDTMYIMTRSISQGKEAGLASVAGIISGCLVHVLCAAFGLSLILTTSAQIFWLVKWAGALYLIYLGLKTLFEKQALFDQKTSKNESKTIFKIYKQGILTNVLNPKVALFFLSFLPQFINPEYAAGPGPFLLLGAIFLFTSTLWCLSLSFMASSMTATLRAHPSIGIVLQKISGFIFIGFGLKLALSKN
ncbi:MAG: LysE family translocator [Desulfobacula sp.]|nr:LysE family translocator [Desulfobacula sp.]